MTRSAADRMPHFASVISRRRSELGLARDDVRHRGGPGEATMGRLENATADTPLPRRRTLDRLDRALEWVPGTARAVLDGHTPTAGNDTVGPAASDTARADPARGTFTVELHVIGRLMDAATAALPALLDPSAEHSPPNTAELADALRELAGLYSAALLDGLTGDTGLASAVAIANAVREKNA